MTALSAREKTIITITAVVAMLAMAYIFVAEPLMAEWKKKESRITYLSGKSEMMNRALADENELLERYEKISEIAVISGSTENTSRLLLEKIGALARNSGVTARGLSPLPPQQYDFYSRISVRMDVECTLEQLVSFLYAIKTGDKQIEVTRMEISPRDRESDVLRGHLELTATVLKKSGEETVETEE